MQKTTLYVVLAVVGAVVPMIAFVPWLVVHGPDLRLMCAELFANRVSTFFAVDLLLTGITVAIFARVEGRSERNRWVVIAAMLVAGVSAGLPLLLFFRERAGAAGSVPKAQG